MTPAKSKTRRILLHPVARLIIGLVAVVVVAMLIGGGATAVFSFFLKESMAYSIGSLFLGLAAVGAYALLYRFYENRQITELSVRGLGRYAALGFGIGIALIAFVTLIIATWGDYTVTGFLPVRNLLFALLLALSAGLLEEVLFRGIIFRLIEEMAGTWWAVAVSALLFGLLHIFNENMNLWGCLAIAVEAGIMLAAVYVWCRNLWLPIFVHTAWNFAEGGLFGFPVSGNDFPSWPITEISGPQWLTGGASGPEFAVPTVVLALVVAAVFFVMAYHRGNIAKSIKIK